MRVAGPLLLRGGLVHQIENAEIVLGVLEIALGHHPVAAAGRVASQLQIFLKQLLGCAADADVGTIAVEHVVAVERNSASRMMAHTPATTTTTTTAAATAAATTASSATAAGALVAATHAFHVHSVAVVLSRCGAAGGSSDHSLPKVRRVSPPANPDSSALVAFVPVVALTVGVKTLPHVTARSALTLSRFHGGANGYFQGSRRRIAARAIPARSARAVIRNPAACPIAATASYCPSPSSSTA